MAVGRTELHRHAAILIAIITFSNAVETHIGIRQTVARRRIDTYRLQRIDITFGKKEAVGVAVDSYARTRRIQAPVITAVVIVALKQRQHLYLFLIDDYAAVALHYVVKPYSLTVGIIALATLVARQCIYRFLVARRTQYDDVVVRRQVAHLGCRHAAVLLAGSEYVVARYQ